MKRQGRQQGGGLLHAAGEQGPVGASTRPRAECGICLARMRHFTRFSVTERQRRCRASRMLRLRDVGRECASNDLRQCVEPRQGSPREGMAKGIRCGQRNVLGECWTRSRQDHRDTGRRGKRVRRPSRSPTLVSTSAPRRGQRQPWALNWTLRRSRAAGDSASRRGSTRRQLFCFGSTWTFCPASRKSGGAPLSARIPARIPTHRDRRGVSRPMPVLRTSSISARARRADQKSSLG